MTTVTITLSDEDKDFIQAAVKAGRYVTESEAVSEAIAELRAHAGEDCVEAIRCKVQEGIEQLDSGRGIVWKVDDIRAEGKKLMSPQD